MSESWKTCPCENCANTRSRNRETPVHKECERAKEKMKRDL